MPAIIYNRRRAEVRHRESGEVARGAPLSEARYGSNGHPGEVHYFDAFSRNVSLVDLEKTWRSYAERFPALSENEVKKGVLTYEKSPSYLRFRQAPRLLSTLLPSCAWIIILRDPVDRAYSAFAHHVRHGRFGVAGRVEIT